MSFLTGTQAELIYNMNPLGGATLSNFTTQALLTPGVSSSYQACRMPDPASTWPQGVLTKAYRYVARGTWGDTSAAPTMRLQLGFDTTQGTFGAIYAGHGAATLPALSISNAAGGGGWEFEMDMVVSAVAMSTGVFSYSVYPLGLATFATPTGAVTSTQSGVTAITGSANPITLVSSSTYWLELWATCGTANASNAISCYHAQLFGLN